ncbi:protein mono-ADP-ribosyltransferase PARP14-like [Polypterus senegalus]|uniref:protein mono-ADP-ribosyltransferase PARP14-like n=1 Tax=Polypterus senegalus TaxID=55291 RepID=UPI001965E516|nr:protein mono-ADP-ribosyltransferase PARP14-like [Polypterus senegalus]
MADDYPFELFVEGNFGGENSSHISNKLQIYFQSKKRANGGDCFIEYKVGENYAVVRFKSEQIRQQVLQKENHVLIKGDESLTLTVRLPEDPESTSSDSEIKARLPKKDAKCVDEESNAQEASPFLKKFKKDENEEIPPSTLIFVENIPTNKSTQLLEMLVENISGLSLEKGDFSIEFVDLGNAVVSFNNRRDAEDFLARCFNNRTFKQNKMCARCLDVTKSIIIENLPSTANDDCLNLYFERYGTIQDLSLTEGQAIITFVNHNVFQTVLKKTHTIFETEFKVYPFYYSISAALYGKDGPQLKMPEPILININYYIWQLLKVKRQYIEDISFKMNQHFCHLTWPELSETYPAVTITPTEDLMKQKPLKKYINEWKNEAPLAFSNVLSMYKHFEFKYDSSVLIEAKQEIENVVRDRVYLLPFANVGRVVIVGPQKDVDFMQQRVKDVYERTAKKIERDQKTILEQITVSSPIYSVLKRDGFEHNAITEYPVLKLTYNSDQGRLELIGLAEEVYPVKSQFLQGLIDLKRKQIKLDVHLIHFLASVDNEDVSSRIFASKQINAIYEIEKNVKNELTLIVSKNTTLDEAEKQMTKILGVCYIELRDHKVTEKQEWLQLLKHLEKTVNSTQKRIIIFQQKAQIVVSGFQETVSSVCEQLSDFININTIICEKICINSAATVKFLKERKNGFLKKMGNNDVKIDFSSLKSQPGVTLKGPRLQVLEIKQLIEKEVQTLYADIYRINKPGAKKLFKMQEDIYCSIAKEKFSCIVILQDDEFKAEVWNRTDQIFCQVLLPGGQEVAVCKADMCSFPTDVVVNTSNEDLKHIGGLAAALLQAAGPDLQDQCDKYTQKNGKVKVGDVVKTAAGNLPCKYVLHAVGPRWHSKSESEPVLKNVVMKTLKSAEDLGCKSIAIPAISSGIFGYPLDLCAETIVNSIREYYKNSHEGSSLRKVNLVDNDDKTVQAISEAVQRIFANEKVTLKAPQVKAACKSMMVMKKGMDSFQTQEGVTIRLEKGNIQDASTDVIVNTIPSDLNLNSGAVSKAILAVAGSELQTLINGEAQNSTVAAGSVLRTQGCNLKCSFVLHAVAPHWSSGNELATQLLKQVIRTCLSETEKLQKTSIAFPAIGTGNLGFPKALVASLMFDEVVSFSSKKPENLKEIVFLLHPSDAQTVQAFFEQFKVKCSGNSLEENPVVTTSSTMSPEKGTGSGKISSPSKNVYEMSIGGVRLCIGPGDIVKEKTDVIVNSTNENFTLKIGVSKAILDAAGQEVETECAQLAAQPHNGLIMTKAGNLANKSIIHIVGTTNPQEIKKIVRIILDRCEQSKFSSVAFPALGTGQGKVDPSAVADAMIDAVVEFANQKKKGMTVNEVKIVIFQSQMVTEFHKSMQRSGDTTTAKEESLSSRIQKIAFNSPCKKEKPKEEISFNEAEPEPAVFQLCGESKQCVENTKSWIENQVDQELHEKIIEDDIISKFGESEFEQLRRLQKELEISVKVKCDSTKATITVAGHIKDVLTALTSIQDVMKEIRSTEQLKWEAELTSNLVEWQYEDKGQFIPFDSMTNRSLEQASVDKNTKIKVNLLQQEFSVSVQNCLAINSKGVQVKIKRVDRIRGTILPDNWDDMTGVKGVLCVKLESKLKEYRNVEALFKKTCNNKILKIERIQNSCLWNNYQIRKKAFDEKNVGVANEKLLFHGTSACTIQTINNHGFNRSFAGKNAAAFGNGTYFAVDASYSASHTYSVPDASGNKHMYLCRVLTGVFTKGHGGLVVPPAKSNDPSDLYDSVTDNVALPGMFVIFHDVQAYPEYLITFK